MSIDGQLVAPFPYFGGKRRVAAEVWARLGNVDNYVEPFFGSGAVLLGRPHAPRIETVNDADALLVNFWRAVRADPDAVAFHADWPVSETDLAARHLRLVNRRAEVERLTVDPDAYDAQLAGWWVWGACAWIGSGWCSGDGPWTAEGQLPHLGDAGRGINRKLPHLGDAGQGIGDWMRRLADRLRRVRVACGDWSRVVTPSVTHRHGLTGVFLDPPYDHEGRTTGVYTHDGDIAGEVRAWAVGNGDNPLLRIALCGYEGDYEMPEGWTAHRWCQRKGYAATERAIVNAASEVVWFSPHCLGQQQAMLPLFSHEGAMG